MSPSASPPLQLFTIGFTRKTAEQFFTKLSDAGVRTLIDVRLNNVSQLAGFSKKDDLQFFLRRICNIDYIHMPHLAPTQDMLDAYKKQKGIWSDYERLFTALSTERRIENHTPKATLDHGCLLCSEDKPHQCHRRLVAEYLKEKWRDVSIDHLV